MACRSIVKEDQHDMPRAKNTDASLSKQERAAMRNRQYLSTPKEFRERTLTPVIAGVLKMVEAAKNMGRMAKIDGSDEDSQYMKTLKAQFKKVVDHNVKKLKELGVHHTTMYRCAGKNRVAKMRKGETQSRKQTMYRSLGVFKPELYAFVREASTTNDSLNLVADSLFLRSGSPLRGYMSPVYVSQFILAYVATNNKFNPQNGQFIRPDDLMRKHLGAGIDSVLQAFAVKSPSLSALFPGEFTFCQLQSLISHYRVDLDKNPELNAKVVALRENKDHHETLQREYNALCEVRKLAFKRHHEQNPRPVKPSKSQKKAKGGDENSRLANRMRKSAEASVRATGFELSVTKRAAPVVKTP